MSTNTTHEHKLGDEMKWTRTRWESMDTYTDTNMEQRNRHDTDMYHIHMTQIQTRHEYVYVVRTQI